MTNPIQLLRDFRKWRRERYDEALYNVLDNIPCSGISENKYQAYKQGILYGIEHRKEILKQVKI